MRDVLKNGPKEYVSQAASVYQDFPDVPIGNPIMITIGLSCSGSTLAKSALVNVIGGSDLLELAV